MSGSGGLQIQTGYPAHFTRILLVLPPGLLRLAAPFHDEATPPLTPHPPKTPLQQDLKDKISCADKYLVAVILCYLAYLLVVTNQLALKCNGAKNVIRLAANIIWDSDDPFTRTDLMPP